MIDEKPPHGLGMWQRRFVSREELLERYSMSDEKPSPGPWQWIRVDDDSRVLRHSGSDDPYYSAVFHPDIDGMGIHISDADAALIADAPDMLALLQRVQWAIEDSDGTPPFGTSLLGDIRATLDKHGRAR
jgi:hypothetical protein